MFFRKKTEKKEDEAPAQYLIKPNADGSWHICHREFYARPNFCGFHYQKMDGSYATVDDAKKAIENLERGWVFVK